MKSNIWYDFLLKLTCHNQGLRFYNLTTTATKAGGTQLFGGAHLRISFESAQNTKLSEGKKSSNEPHLNNEFDSNVPPKAFWDFSQMYPLQTVNLTQMCPLKS